MSYRFNLGSTRLHAVHPSWQSWIPQSWSVCPNLLQDESYIVCMVTMVYVTSFSIHLPAQYDFWNTSPPLNRYVVVSSLGVRLFFVLHRVSIPHAIYMWVLGLFCTCVSLVPKYQTVLTFKSVSCNKFIWTASVNNLHTNFFQAWTES